eukprot:1138848-Pelagomonas_calceolata.AAC.12
MAVSFAPKSMHLLEEEGCIAKSGLYKAKIHKRDTQPQTAMRGLAPALVVCGCASQLTIRRACSKRCWPVTKAARPFHEP